MSKVVNYYWFTVFCILSTDYFTLFCFSLLYFSLFILPLSYVTVLSQPVYTTLIDYFEIFEKVRSWTVQSANLYFFICGMIYASSVKSDKMYKR